MVIPDGTLNTKRNGSEPPECADYCNSRDNEYCILRRLLELPSFREHQLVKHVTRHEDREPECGEVVVDISNLAAA